MQPLPPLTLTVCITVYITSTYALQMECTHAVISGLAAMDRLYGGPAAKRWQDLDVAGPDAPAQQVCAWYSGKEQTARIIVVRSSAQGEAAKMLCLPSRLSAGRAALVALGSTSVRVRVLGLSDDTRELKWFHAFGAFVSAPLPFQRAIKVPFSQLQLPVHNTAAEVNSVLWSVRRNACPLDTPFHSVPFHFCLSGSHRGLAVPGA